MPSYEKNKVSGLWSCRFREYLPDGTAKQKRLSGFKTKKEAQYGYEDYIKAAEEQKKEQVAQEAFAADPGNMMFSELLEQYMKFTKGRVKESSYYDIESKVKNRLMPYFTDKKIKEITPKMISDWIETIDYSYSSKIWIFSTLSSIFKYGTKYYDINNVMVKVDRPRNMEMPKEMQIWTPEEFSSFIAHVDGQGYEMLFRTLYVTGCRRGEAQALTWEDLLENHEIRINKSMTTKTKSGIYSITTPKNKGSVRNITVPSFLFDQLLRFREEQKEQLGSEWSPTCFIFGGLRPLPSSTVDHKFSQATQAANIKKIRIHDLRHSCASILISKGVSIVAVSRQLGHSNVEQTLNTYSHMMPDDKTLIRNTLDDLGTQLGTKK
ncbi:MAG: site-specific integrase [Clostridia bacterium]|nr:site-specific integrase [Clostridia bacterium]